MPTASSFPSSAVNTATAGEQAWANPPNIITDNGTFATCSLAAGETSNWLMASGFNFNLPGNAIITGIQADWNVRSSVLSTIQELSVSLLNGLVPVGASRTMGLVGWLLSLVVKTAGSSSDTWSYNNTAEFLNSPNFGIGMRCQNPGVLPGVASVDSVFVTVTYSLVWSSIHHRAQRER